ncbi:unnamed protein product [Symbiodinium natans]|uniref:Uncharacterized protein n=1 Tax=Symbiodinium natans TaxID=878477 RepID=A0A812M5U3_9DINO|nr:unnamed protein product [Symbiodinium natans]
MAWRLLLLSFYLLLFRAAANIANESSNQANGTEGNEIKGVGTPLPLDNSYINPGGSTRCPSRCRRYFAGAGPGDGTICQKQASGVGTAQQNFEQGVACYPAYGCGRDMITCVDQAFEGSLPDTSDAALACADLELVQAEDPWTCGTAEESRPQCNSTANNNAGKWLKANGELGCGWGSTYGNTYPGYTGAGTPATEVFQVSSDFECCLKAMSFENSSWEDGGAALFFQRVGSSCRVDRETIIYANMDSSSGRSVKYQDTRCGLGEQFYYRHAAGAADAANLHTGGRCVVDGGFTRLSELTSGTNLPGGEIPDGHELPNHECPEPDPSETGFSYNCNVTLRFNTINDAEECCEMCRSMSWLPRVGGVVEMDEAGTPTNPCVAWQIVDGRCRIVRQEYFDYWNPGMTIHASLTRNSYEPPGNTGWVVPTRGCGDSEENCNYFSFIYYREFREVDGVAVDPSLLSTNSSNSSRNASYRKVVSVTLPPGAENLSFELNVSAVPSRHDRRPQLIQDNVNRSFARLIGTSFDNVVGGLNSNLTPVTESTAGAGEDCGQIEIHSASAMRSSGDYEIFDEESSPEPICVSECVPSGATASFQCGLPQGAGPERRLATVDSVVISFKAVGSGYDTVDFGLAAASEQGPTATTSTTSGASSTGVGTQPVSSASDLNLVSLRLLALFWAGAYIRHG